MQMTFYDTGICTLLGISLLQWRWILASSRPGSLVGFRLYAKGVWQLKDIAEEHQDLGCKSNHLQAWAPLRYYSAWRTFGAHNNCCHSNKGAFIRGALYTYTRSEEFPWMMFALHDHVVAISHSSVMHTWYLLRPNIYHAEFKRDVRTTFITLQISQLSW